MSRVVVVTGGAKGIGRCIVEEFRKTGASVYVIDKVPGDWFVGDIADPLVLERFVAEVIAKEGHIDVLVNNALPLFRGIDECSYEEFLYAQKVDVAAPFYLAKLLQDHFAAGASILSILRTSFSFLQATRRSSSRARTSVSTAA